MMIKKLEQASNRFYRSKKINFRQDHEIIKIFQDLF